MSRLCGVQPLSLSFLHILHRYCLLSGKARWGLLKILIDGLWYCHLKADRAHLSNSKDIQHSSIHSDDDALDQEESSHRPHLCVSQ